MGSQPSWHMHSRGDNDKNHDPSIGFSVRFVVRFLHKPLSNEKKSWSHHHGWARAAKDRH